MRSRFFHFAAWLALPAVAVHDSHWALQSLQAGLDLLKLELKLQADELRIQADELQRTRVELKETKAQVRQLQGGGGAATPVVAHGATAHLSADNLTREGGVTGGTKEQGAGYHDPADGWQHLEAVPSPMWACVAALGPLVGAFGLKVAVQGHAVWAAHAKSKRAVGGEKKGM